MTKILMTLTAMMLFAVTACGNEHKPTDAADEQTASNQPNNNDEMKKGKPLIVFFSHAGENYAVGNIKVGNTKIVADYISEQTGADQFEIVPEKSYAMPYDDLTKLAQDENQKGELPAFRGEAPDLAPYDTIFIGGPIWWGTYPQVMFTFFNKYDLNGKTLIPFTPPEGSGLASVVDDVKRLYPRATVTGAFAIYGHEVRTEKAKVTQWLKGLGY